MSTDPLVVASDVHAPVEETHGFVIRGFFLNHQRRDPGIAELVAPDDARVRPGRRGREARRFMGTMVTELEVVEADARRLTIRDVPSAWTLERTRQLDAHHGWDADHLQLRHAPDRQRPAHRDLAPRPGGGRA